MKETYLVTIYRPIGVSSQQMKEYIEKAVSYGGDQFGTDNPLYGYKTCVVRELPPATKIVIEVNEL